MEDEGDDRGPDHSSRHHDRSIVEKVSTTRSDVVLVIAFVFIIVVFPVVSFFFIVVFPVVRRFISDEDALPNLTTPHMTGEQNVHMELASPHCRSIPPAARTAWQYSFFCESVNN